MEVFPEAIQEPNGLLRAYEGGHFLSYSVVNGEWRDLGRVSTDFGPEVCMASPATR